MGNGEKISVCIPFYNIEPYARRCLDSVLNNTYKNLEVICVNDGSIDGTSMLLHEYAKKDHRVIVIDKENGGIISARNAAIEVATGDVITFIDGDDWVHTQYFETLMFVRSMTKADVVVCDHLRCMDAVTELPIDLNRVTYKVEPITYVLNDDEVRSMISGRLFSRQIASEVKGASDIQLGEDAIFNLTFLCNKPDLHIAIVHEKIYYYYQREGSLAHIISHNQRIKVSQYFMKHYDEYSETQVKCILLHEIIRNMAAYRYLQMFTHNKSETKATCYEIYTFCRKRWNGIFLWNDKMKYTVLYYCPFIYRLFRIVTDPTMLDWERAEKKRRREKAGQ